MSRALLCLLLFACDAPRRTGVAHYEQTQDPNILQLVYADGSTGARFVTGISRRVEVTEMGIKIHWRVPVIPAKSSVNPYTGKITPLVAMGEEQ